VNALAGPLLRGVLGETPGEHPLVLLNVRRCICVCVCVCVCVCMPMQGLI
jgi:hypothetical protein